MSPPPACCFVFALLICPKLLHRPASARAASGALISAMTHHRSRLCWQRTWRRAWRSKAAAMLTLTSPHLACLPAATKEAVRPKKSWWYGVGIADCSTPAAHPFDTAITSWNAFTPAGTWLQSRTAHIRPPTTALDQILFELGWSLAPTLSSGIASPDDADGSVATDTRCC